ncbi:hypothetical protein F4808DRAFT_79142 [Astrocystis sublimbata]|nr:hypothetical protein F4808DRAFT_79142 [Astrocystis sublimbata]
MESLNPKLLEGPSSTGDNPPKALVVSENPQLAGPSGQDEGRQLQAQAPYHPTYAMYPYSYPSSYPLPLPYSGSPVPQLRPEIPSSHPALHFSEAPVPYPGPAYPDAAIPNPYPELPIFRPNPYDPYYFPQDPPAAPGPSPTQEPPTSTETALGVDDRHLSPTRRLQELPPPRSRARPRAKLSKKQKSPNKKRLPGDAKAEAKLVKPLSALAADFPDAQAKMLDIREFVRRGAEERTRAPSRGKPETISRPLNPFLLYRKAYHPVAMALADNNNNATVSVLVGLSWHRETKAVKSEFAELGRVERQEHTTLFPHYTFSPKTKPKLAVAEQWPSNEW